MSLSLPRPTCITILARVETQRSENWASIIYVNVALTNEHVAELRRKVSFWVPVNYFEAELTPDFSVVRVEFRTDNPYEGPNQFRKTLLRYMNPRYRAFMYSLTKTVHGSKEVAFLEFIVEYAHRKPEELGQDIARVLAPLGERVACLPFSPKGRFIYLTIDAYKAPQEELSAFIYEQLLPLGLFLIVGDVQEVTPEDYEELTRPKMHPKG